jgi:hypothetical protein
MQRSPASEEASDPCLEQQPPQKIQKTKVLEIESAFLALVAAPPPPPPEAMPLPPSLPLRVNQNGDPRGLYSWYRNPWKSNPLVRRSTPTPAVCHLALAAAASAEDAAATVTRLSAPRAVPHLQLIADSAGSGFDADQSLHCIAELYAQPAYLRAFQMNQRQLAAALPRRAALCPAAPWNVAGMNVALQHGQRLKLIGTGHACVLLAMRLLRHGCVCPYVKYPLVLARSILSRRHVMPFYLLPTPMARLKAHGVNCLSVAFHPRLQLMATGSHDKTAKLWHFDASTRSVAQTATLEGHTDWVWCVAFHSRLPLLATSSRDFTAKLWVISDDLTAVCSATLRGHDSWVCSVVFHPIFPFLATGGNDGRAKIWLLERDGSVGNEGACTDSVYAHSSIVVSVALHPTLLVLATGGDNRASLWTFDSGGKNITCFATLEGHSDWVWCVAFHSTLPLLASGSEDGTVRLWLVDPQSTAASSSATLEGHAEGVNTVAFHPSLPLLASGSGDSTVKLWLMNMDGTSAQCTSTLTGQGESVSSVAFHPHLPLLATGIRDGTVHLWR